MEKELNFAIVITGHRALSYTKRCVESIECQIGGFQPKILYVDDASNYTQSEKEQLVTILQRVNGRVIFLSKRHYQIGSLSQAIPQIDPPNSIVCLIDSDDYLLSHALQTVSEAYADDRIAMSYGNVLLDFRPYQNTQAEYFYDKRSVNTEYPLSVWKDRSFRRDGFRCFHLRTFRKWLWDLIDPKDFCRLSGEYFHASGDSAFVYPMLEMLGDPAHIAFIESPLYVYRLYEGNVHNYDKKSQTDDLEYIRFSLPRYPLLDRNKLNQLLSLG